ncbi:MAG: Fe-S protein assembly co-chaperone HscB [Pontibacterium sp.]
MDIRKNYFELFALPESFTVDQAALSEAYIALQREQHPDRHAHLSDAQVRVSEQNTAYLNEAFATLKSPLRRAMYLLLLQGVDVSADTSMQLAPDFLFQQMELRERLADAESADDPFEVLEALEQEVTEALVSLRNAFEQALAATDLKEAEALVRKMQFFEKVGAEVSELESRLDD